MVRIVRRLVGLVCVAASDETSLLQVDSGRAVQRHDKVNPCAGRCRYTESEAYAACNADKSCTHVGQSGCGCYTLMTAPEPQDPCSDHCKYTHMQWSEADADCKADRSCTHVGKEVIQGCGCYTLVIAPCDISFGRGAADPNQIVSIIDIDLPKAYCDYFNLSSSPGTYIHRASAAAGCQPPFPEDACHSYIKVVYSQCDGLNDVIPGLDPKGRFDSKTGVFTECEDFVTSRDTTYWAPNKPRDAFTDPPDDYEAIKCSKKEWRCAGPGWTSSSC